MLWAWLSRSWQGWRSAIHIVKPETVLAWHRQGFRLFHRCQYMRRHPRPPSQTWRTFLTNHAFLVILAHDRRRIVHVAVTAHPAGCGEPSTTPARCSTPLFNTVGAHGQRSGFLRKLLRAARRASEHEDSREPILGRRLATDPAPGIG